MGAGAPRRGARNVGLKHVPNKPAGANLALGGGPFGIVKGVERGRRARFDAVYIFGNARRLSAVRADVPAGALRARRGEIQVPLGG